jgi:hypothetical protein
MDREEIRTTNLAWLRERGFRAATWMPIRRTAVELQPLIEIVRRFLALRVTYAWVCAPEDKVPTLFLQREIEAGSLERVMTSEDRRIVNTDRAWAKRAFIDTIGWKLENMWPLAWVLGFAREPRLDGSQIASDETHALVHQWFPLPPSDLANAARALDEVVALEDRFYLCHNAVRGAQIGSPTVPSDFDPVNNGGVIHERRHALTWCLSPGTRWEDTDLST